VREWKERSFENREIAEKEEGEEEKKEKRGQNSVNVY